MVMTLLYRTNGWRGVYVPQILARGLTPVDWGNYLIQQRRWARSVLDFKIRVFPKYSSRLPVLQRILTYLHGLYYLQGPLRALQISLLLFMLVTNLVPNGSGTLFLLHTGAIWLTVLACDFYRQRFFLDPRTEWGFHWRSAFVDFVKWPYFVLAFKDAVLGHIWNLPYHEQDTGFQKCDRFRYRSWCSTRLNCHCLDNRFYSRPIRVYTATHRGRFRSDYVSCSRHHLIGSFSATVSSRDSPEVESASTNRKIGGCGTYASR